jgi:hypothetical protein
MNAKQAANHVSKCIISANMKKSKITTKELQISGFTSVKIRHLLNNLLELPNTNYLEIGTFKGSTFVSALYKNNIKNAYAIDNWSEFQEYGEIKEEFLENTKNLNFTFIEEDCFKLDLSQIKEKINIYLYDGEHRYEDQYKALEYYYSILDDVFIFIVDDFDPFEGWEGVEKGTKDSIKDLKLRIIFDQHLKSNGRNDGKSWWNGYYIAVLKKTQ